MGIFCRKEGWRFTPVCRDAKGRFAKSGKKPLPRYTRIRPLPQDLLERLKKRAKEAEELRQLFIAAKRKRNQQMAAQVRRLAQAALEKWERDEAEIQDILDEISHARRSEEANIKLEAYRQAEQLRQALKNSKHNRVDNTLQSVVKQATKVETAPLNAFQQSHSQTNGWTRRADGSFVDNKGKVWWRYGNGFQSNFGQDFINSITLRRAKRPPTGRPLLDWDVPPKPRPTGKITIPMPQSVINWARRIARTGGEAAEFIDDALNHLPSKALEALGNPLTQLGMEGLMVQRNVARFRKQGAGDFETWLGQAGRFLGIATEQLVSVPYFNALPFGEIGGEVIGRGTGRVLDRTPLGDRIRGAAKGVGDNVIRAAKGLDNVVKNTPFRSKNPIDTSNPRKPNPYNEVNDPNAPKRPCVGIQCAVNPWL